VTGCMAPCRPVTRSRSRLAGGFSCFTKQHERETLIDTLMRSSLGSHAPWVLRDGVWALFACFQCISSEQ
jgi:hypothetical protein